MKNILLASTALIVSAGFAAADTAMSATAKLTYGNYGTGIVPGASARTYKSEADVDIKMTGGGDTVSYSATLELDESGESKGALSISTSGVTLTYDENELGIKDALNALAVAGSSNADGEDDSYADIKVAYAGGGITASYAADINADSATYKNRGYVVNVGYTAGDVALGLETNGDKSTLSVGYGLGDITFAAEATNNSTWEVSAGYTLAAGTTVTVATTDASKSSVAVATSLNGLALTAKTGNAAVANEFTVGYTAGDIGFKIGYDSANGSKYGDEAETTLVVDYAIDGLGIQLKANNQSEMELSTSLSF